MRLLVIVAAVAAALPIAAARADPFDPAKADALFDAGKKLEQAGDRTGACAKYSEALKFNPEAVGTIMNVGRCNQEAGLWASAAKRFRRALDLATERDLAAYRAAASQQLTDIEPRVPHISLAFGIAPLPDTKVVVADVVIPLDAVGDIAVDPGEVLIEISAPHRVPFEKRVRVVERQHLALAVPPLPEPVTIKHGMRTAGAVTAGIGVAAAIAATVAALVAHEDYQRPYSAQPGPTTAYCDASTGECNPAGFRAQVNAHSLGNAATVVGVASAVAIGVGATLFVLGPHDEHHIALVPQLNPSSAGLAAVGSF